MKLWLRLEPSVPPLPAVAPAAETTPARPPGICTVTLVFSRYPTAGVKTASSPWSAQWPAIDGDSVGIGEPGASGAENCTRMGLVPLTPFAPAAGVTETSCRPAAGCSGLDAFTGPAADTREAWLPGDANATITTPAPRTSAALLAVRAAPLLFNGLETLKDCLIRLAAELSSLTSDVCFLRNHPDPDTAPSPPRDFTIGQKFRPQLKEASTTRWPLLLLTDAHAREKVAGISRSRPPPEARRGLASRCHC